MKKILITGKTDEELTELSKRLSARYTVRFGSSVSLAALSILESFKPDLIVSRISETDRSVFARIAAAYSDRPLILIGADDGAGQVFGMTPRAVCGSMDEVYNAVIAAFPDTADPAPSRPVIRVVDDDATMLRMMKLVLEDEYELMLAPSGAKALKLLERKVPDLIMLDYEMPEMNGVETFGKLRDDSRFANIPVIFLTGVSELSAFEAIISCGASGHLVKPADAANIKASITSVLKK